jgi:hypothetical protein
MDPFYNFWRRLSRIRVDMILPSLPRKFKRGLFIFFITDVEFKFGRSILIFFLQDFGGS